MTPLLHRITPLYLLCGLLFSGLCAADTLHIEQPWARATAAGAEVGAAYLTVRNDGQTDQLLSVSSPASAVVEIHNMQIQDGRMQMRPVQTLTIPAGGTVQLAPGGLHLMLMKLHAPLLEGGFIELTLNFKHAGTRTVQAHIAGLGAVEAPGHDHSHHH